MLKTAIDTKKTALLIIDMQKHFLDGTNDFFAGVRQQVAQGKVIENTENALKAVRAAKLPVYHITTGHKADRSDVVPTITDMESTAKLPQLVEGTPAAEIVEELKPIDGESIVFKRRHGAFYQTDLKLLLKNRNVDTLLFAGILTDVCVAITFYQARMRDYHVILLSDCCASSTRKRHDYFIENMFPRHARVRTSSQIIEAL
ncbi:cysteine hydrolase family protein [Chloroflexota bacterium]